MAEVKSLGVLSPPLTPGRVVGAKAADEKRRQGRRQSLFCKKLFHPTEESEIPLRQSPSSRSPEAKAVHVC